MKLTILTLLIFNISLILGANNIDSLILETKNANNRNIAETYNKIAKQYRNNSFEDCYKYANLALNKAKETNNIKEQAKSYNYIGDAYFYQNNFSEALKRYNEALEL